MVNPRRSTKPVLPLEEITTPFKCVFTQHNDNQPGIGRCVTLQINNNKVSFPLNQPISLSVEFYELVKDLIAAGREFFSPNFGDYDIDSEFEKDINLELKQYEPSVS